jgi:chorismate mutase
MVAHGKKVWALRGAISVERNDAQSILSATAELLRAVIARNNLDREDLISCIFTVTEDLDAAFPAQAARELGLTTVPLLCAREIPVPGSAPRIVRLLLHYYGPPEVQPQHVYLGEARALREDLAGAQ